MAYNPNEPRDEKGRWTTDGFADAFYPKTQLPGPVGPKGPANALSRNDADSCRQLSVVNANAIEKLKSWQAQLDQANAAADRATENRNSAREAVRTAFGEAGINIATDCVRGAIAGFKKGGIAGAIRGCGVGSIFSPGRFVDAGAIGRALENADDAENAYEDAQRVKQTWQKGVAEAEAEAIASAKALRDGGCTAA